MGILGAVFVGVSVPSSGVTVLTLHATDAMPRSRHMRGTLSVEKIPVFMAC